MKKLENSLLGIYKILTENWNAIFSGISVLGILIFQFTPGLQKYQNFFIFLGLNAIVWTLVEIKVSLVNNTKTTRYESMRIARNHILEAIKKSNEKVWQNASNYNNCWR